ncbi:hypothetical protein COCSUDRAFT_63283 [Coccomyxa subellipsoidea C-169]|uniref:Uncharacterized protein n=1 Tax=Coccomyxa subellipsoidea (strain C-169) TaxID=574566 RepID=I0YZD9_COCSC|nr:hypothetical protein COCSUDRAFT_63283 [Coccomyxa subellipsoidea C-169]EIE23758.1 hypothetical protein COCSUDRAFT_63283 [Coccomyxa subellipsoidea C-169]|eukprot:XP_005648302.1 hypothetical protein COCSUDRAFT_63283 [Coccomyxa subellipsoidea C-169]
MAAATHVENIDLQEVQDVWRKLLKAGATHKQLEEAVYAVALEESEHLPKIPVIYSASNTLYLTSDFEAFAKEAAADSDPQLSLAKKHRDNPQLRPELYPLIFAYGKSICDSRPHVAKVLSMLMSQRLEALIAQLKPQLQIQSTWGEASALVEAMRALLRGGRFGSCSWFLDGIGHIDPAVHYEGLKADVAVLSKEDLQKGIKFLDRQLDHAPRDLRASEEAIEQLRAKFGAAKVDACAAFLGSEDGCRLREAVEQGRKGLDMGSKRQRYGKPESIWDFVARKLSPTNFCNPEVTGLCRSAVGFADAFPEHWFLCPLLWKLDRGDRAKLDGDACMCALAAVNGSIDLGQAQGKAEAVHERAGLLFAAETYCTLALEWVPALVQWRVEFDEEIEGIERVLWGRNNGAAVPERDADLAEEDL